MDRQFLNVFGGGRRTVKERSPDSLPPRLCSKNTRRPAYANFINKTQHDIAVEWLDFEGNHVPYEERLGPGQNLRMNTYKEHPWVFYESDLRHELAFLPDREKIYFPVEWEGGDRVSYEVHIVSPNNTLEQICLNFIHRYLFMDCRLKTTDSLDGVVDRLQEERLLPVPLGTDLKKLFHNQKDTNIAVYR